MEVPVNPLVHWLGAGGLAVGAAVIGGVILKSRREDVSHGVLHLFVCLVALLAYLSFIFDRTAVHIDGRSFYVSHFVSWVLTWPMIVIGVALVGLPPLQNMVERRVRASMMGGLAGTAILWTGSALFQALARTEAERWTWFGLSAVTGAALVWQLSGPVRSQGEIKGGENLGHYKLLAALATVTIIGYQAVWLIGEAGLKLISSPVESPIFLVLDLVSDAALGILSVALVERLVHETKPEPGDTAVAASARGNGHSGPEA
jgi:bacteriorhodopsin